mmetsp:Transcript_74/g.168  ORF Transcript_74/g.168 Transcript_74/m.168 type:complete len:117 (-) Transcript_74:150-500(-)
MLRESLFFSAEGVAAEAKRRDAQGKRTRLNSKELLSSGFMYLSRDPSRSESDMRYAFSFGKADYNNSRAIRGCVGGCNDYSKCPWRTRSWYAPCCKYLPAVVNFTIISTGRSGRPS